MGILDFAISVADFRQPWKVRHLSTDIIFITVAAVICGAKDWEPEFCLTINFSLINHTLLLGTSS